MKLLSILAAVACLIASCSIATAQTLPNAVPAPSAQVQYLDQNGAPLAGAFLCSFAAGTTTPQVTYTDSTAGTPNPNPIVLDAAGRAQFWIGSLSYKFVLQVGGNGACPGTGAVQFTEDNIQDVSLYFVNYVRTIGNATLITYTGAGTGGVSRTVSAGLLDWVKAADYGAVCDGSTDDTTHIQAALNYAASTPGKNRGVLLPAGICKGNWTIATNNQSIYGAGWGTANPDGPGQVTELLDASGGASPVITVTADYVGIFNVKLVGNGTDGGMGFDRGIYAANQNYLDVENVSCSNFAEECVRWAAGAAFRGVHITADNTLLNRTRIAHSGAIYMGGTDGFLSDTEVGVSTSLAGHSASNSCFNDAVVVAGANSFLSNVIGETSELGLYLSGGQTRVVNSRFDLNYCSGAWIASGGNQISNTLLLRNGRDGNGNWDALEYTATNNVSTNVIIDQTSGVTLTFGVTDTTSSGNTNYNTFSGFRFFSVTQATWWNVTASLGPEVAYGYKDIITIADGTSSPNLTGFSLFEFLQSTPLSITSFAGGIPGQSACFIGNANVTLGTGGNIHPPNAVNQPLQASQMYCYRNVSGTWYWTNTDNNPQFANVTASANNKGLDVIAGHLHGISGIPAIAAEDCGTGCTASITGTDVAGIITINTGTGVPGTTNHAVRVTWNRTFLSAGPVCVASPEAILALSGGVIPNWYMAQAASGQSIIGTNSIGFAGSSTVVFAYVCAQGQGL